MLPGISWFARRTGTIESVAWSQCNSNSYYLANVVLTALYAEFSESEIERISSSILNFNEFIIKDFQWRRRPQNQKKSRRLPMEDDSYFDVFKEIVFNYQARNEWERLRSENLSNNDKITIVVKCENCGLIFPYPITIETEDLDSLFCRRCNHPRLKPYEFENDSNSLYLKEILSRFNVI